MIVENYWWLQLGDKYWFQPPGGVRRQEARADAIALEGGQDSSWRILSPATHLVPSSSSHGSALLECLVHRPYHSLVPRPFLYGRGERGEGRKGQLTPSRPAHTGRVWEPNQPYHALQVCGSIDSRVTLFTVTLLSMAEVCARSLRYVIRGLRFDRKHAGAQPPVTGPAGQSGFLVQYIKRPNSFSDDTTYTLSLHV